MNLGDARNQAMCVKIVSNLVQRYPYIFTAIWNDLKNEDIDVDPVSIEEIKQVAAELKKIDEEE